MISLLKLLCQELSTIVNTKKDPGKFKLADRLTQHPLLSVIIPNWNGVDHLPTCLGSLRYQTYPNMEVILVDNASTDQSVALVRRDYPDVVLVQLDENLGLTGGINRGVQVARGEIIALLNNDTEVVPGWAEALVTALRDHPDAGMVASKMLLFDRRGILPLLALIFMYYDRGLIPRKGGSPNACIRTYNYFQSRIG